MVVKSLRELSLIRMASAGYNIKTIAERLKVSRQTISRWLRKKEIQEMLSEYIRNQAMIEDEFLRKLEGIITDTLQQILLNGNNSEKLKAIELYWKHQGEIVSKVDLRGSIDITEKSTEQLEEDVEKLKEKLRELIGGENYDE